MTTHELARMLLDGPDVIAVVPIPGRLPNHPWPYGTPEVWRCKTQQHGCEIIDGAVIRGEKPKPDSGDDR